MSLKRKATELAVASAKKPKSDGSITSFFGAPKPSSTGTTSTNTSNTAANNFNKEKWVSSLTDEQRELLKLEIETLHESWLAHLKEEVVSSSFLELKRFLKKELEAGKKIFPPQSDIYSWYVGIVTHMSAPALTTDYY